MMNNMVAHINGTGAWVRAGRVASMLRLASEIAEHGGDKQGATRHLLAGLCRIVGGDVSALIRFPPSAGMPEQAEEMFVAGADDTTTLAIEEFYIGGRGHLLDPVCSVLMQHPGPTTIDMRERIVSDREWYRSHFVDHHRRSWNLDHQIYGLWLEGDGRQCGFGVTRCWGAPPFAEEDLDLLRLFQTGCAPLFEQPRPATASAPEAALSPRQRQTLERLLGGESAKQIADALQISTNTLNHYVKAVYRAFGVTSRAELMTRCLATRR
jgi:DNA-binding CsgD family transcriptional regulator